MIQELFVYMHQTIDELQNDFSITEDLDEELSLLEKYLSIKELSEDIADELNRLQKRLLQFEKEQGFLQSSGIEEEINNNQNEKFYNPQQVDPAKENDQVVIQLDEAIFFSFQKGIGFYDLWMYDQAAHHFEQVIEKYPDFNLARLYTAMTYLKSKRYLEAKSEISLMLQSTDDPDLISLGQNILGIIASYRRSFIEAEKHFRQAVELKEKWSEPKFNLAIVYYKTNRLNKAISLLEGLLDDNQKDWEVLLYLGKVYQKLKNFEQANAYYRQAYALTKQPKIIQQLAKQFEINRDFSQASRWYKRWLVLEPKNTIPLLGFAKNLWLSGQQSEGLLIMKKALTLDGENIEALLLYAWMLTGYDNERALTVVNHIVSLREMDIPNKPYLTANIARLYYLHHDQDKSDIFNQFLLNSSNSQICGLGNIVQGLINLDLNKPEVALTYLGKSASVIRFPYLDFYLGYCYYLLEDEDQATFYWNRLVDNSPVNTENL